MGKQKNLWKGNFYHPDREVYEGNWKDDKANGKGNYLSKKGINYNG